MKTRQEIEAINPRPMPRDKGSRCACCGAVPDERRPECEAGEVARLRDIIGGLYVARGGNRWELYTAIKRAFRASTGDGS